MSNRGWREAEQSSRGWGSREKRRIDRRSHGSEVHCAVDAEVGMRYTRRDEIMSQRPSDLRGIILTTLFLSFVPALTSPARPIMIANPQRVQPSNQSSPPRWTPAGQVSIITIALRSRPVPWLLPNGLVRRRLSGNWKSLAITIIHLIGRPWRSYDSIEIRSLAFPPPPFQNPPGDLERQAAPFRSGREH